MKVVNEEGIGSGVKEQALALMTSFAVDATNKPKMYSDALLKVGCLLF